jgi:regulator of RNase E activity RraA
MPEEANHPASTPLAEETIARLREVETATLATQLYTRGYRTRVVRSTVRLRPGGARMVGVARTLRYVAMREDLDTLERWKHPSNPQRRIADEIEPGQVLVIEAREDTSCGTMGGMLVARMMKRGAAGLVSDGPFRDGPFIAGLDLPCYANGMNANTNLIAHHPEDLDVTITCGGVMVRPGDVVVGDDESVIVIPRHLADELAVDALEQERREAWILRRVTDGSPVEGTYPMDEATRQAYEAERGRG